MSFEQYGKPAVVLCTEPFIRTARAIASVLKVPEYRFVAVEHPLGSRSRDEVKVLAEDAYRQGVGILTGANA